MNASPGWTNSPVAGAQPAFPPSVVVEVRRLACEIPSRQGVPLARLTVPELQREVIARGIVAQISGVTLWRWLSADALQPWRHRSWIFARDPHFAEKAGPVLDLYARSWEGTALGPDEFVMRPMRNRASKRDAASMPRWAPPRVAPSELSTSTFVKAH